MAGGRGYRRRVPASHDAAAVAEAFASDPASAAIVTDFDGTLSPIVVDPAGARPLPGAVGVLHSLAGRYGRVAVVSGRPAAFLADRLGLASRPRSRLAVAGLYGLERWDAGAGAVAVAAGARPWAGVVRGVVARAASADLGGARVEDKGLSGTVHYREAPEA